jgi:hypothetical protein
MPMKKISTRGYCLSDLYKRVLPSQIVLEQILSLYKLVHEGNPRLQYYINTAAEDARLEDANAA